MFIKKNKNITNWQKNNLKIFLIIFVFMIFIFSGCSNKSSNNRYVIALESNFPPFGYKNSNGEYVGMDIDILSEVLKDQNIKYEIKLFGFSGCVAALESNQVDAVIAGMTVTDERKNKYDFSDSYFESGVVMAVKKENNEIKNYSDLKGKRVVAKIGTTGASFAESIKDKYGFTVKCFEESPSMYDEVKVGNSEACFEDFSVMSFSISNGNELKICTNEEGKKSYAAAVMKGKNGEFLEKFNVGLNKIKENGKYKEIIEKNVGKN